MIHLQEHWEAKLARPERCHQDNFLAEVVPYLLQHLRNPLPWWIHVCLLLAMLFESIDLLCVWAFSHAPVARKLIVVSSRKCVYAAMPPLLLNLLEKSDWDSRLVYVTASLRDCICLPLYPGLLERADKGHSNCVRCIRSVFLSPTPVELPKRFLPLLYLFFILNKNLILRQY